MPQWILTILALPPEGSTASVGIDALHVFVITITMLVSVLVALLAAYYVVRYRRKHEGQLTPVVTASVWSEWTLISIILGTFLVWWVIGYHQYAQMEDPPDGSMRVYVTAKQWMWKFTYPDGTSANDVLTVPVGRPVALEMTSRDVIHSFYVPGFRIKRDVLPGRYTRTWFQATKPGTYPILCAEYCGTSHSMMRGTVVVLDEEEYGRFLRRPSRDASGGTDLVAMGEQVAARRECLACHSINGQPHVGPTWAGLYGSWVTTTDGRRVLADEAYLTRSMMEPNADVVAGFKPVMPTYFGQLDQPEVAAVVEYIKSLRDAATVSGVQLPKIDVRPVEIEDAGAPAAGVPAAPRSP